MTRSTVEAGTTAPPTRLTLAGDDGFGLVRAGDVSPSALYTAVDASRTHLEPWMPWAHGYEPARAEESLARARSSWDAGEEYIYALVEPDGAVAGASGLHRRIGAHGLEIGYWVRADLVGRGLATRASATLIEAAFALDGIDTVEIHHDEANVQSGAVPRRLGFTQVGRSTREPEAPGCVGVEIVWRLTRPE